ncbi:unnamed protein product [Didymodactylos carnosus]|uniref:Uncharacterized protein n=1 Tax=Didymodactylos carnosus TaxID=1234261 RepID=A0A8S2EF17_9BILA|nr:unnamed protein product [Didymodactylos carnosus]CAF4018172.1 unnamed protein product [Didymodactylos carnosus]
MVISISLQNNVGKVTSAMLPDSFTLDEFTKMLSEKLGDIEGHRFVMDGKQLRLNDKQTFNQQKEQITNGKVIFVLDRLPGGGYLEMSLLIDIVLVELENELGKVKKQEHQCAVCMDSKQCMKLCCSKICQECFIRYFKTSNLILKCMVCLTRITYENFFVSKEFIKTLISLDEIKTLMKNIDCQICHCGTLVVNEKLYPKQTCLRCKRCFCFFCNKNWNDEQMLNVSKFTCHSNCDYETRITYELVLLQYNNAVQVPSRRCCPQCLNLGAYDEKCKYHCCTICKHVFCFICLEPEEECKRKYNSSYRLKCTDIKEQDYSIFPKIND